jgi:hypothetical protein
MDILLYGNESNTPVKETGSRKVKIYSDSS